MNANKRRDLALTHVAPGISYVKLASEKRSSGEQRNAHLREARASFQKSLDIWQDMHARGTLIAADAGKPDEVAREIARLEHLLKQ